MGVLPGRSNLGALITVVRPRVGERPEWAPLSSAWRLPSSGFSVRAL